MAIKKFFRIICLLTLVLSLTACGAYFNGSRIGNDSEFNMEYTVLNAIETDEFDVEINEGGTYTVTAAGKNAKGSVSFTVESVR